MGFTLGKGVCIGSAFTLFVLVLLRWWFRTKGAKQIENIAEVADESTAEVSDGGNTSRDETLEPRHKVFLSHSGAQKDFVEQLCVDLERYDRHPFFDKRRDSIPIGTNFPKLILEAIEQCEVGVVVLSKEFFTRSKWPMLELAAMAKNSRLVIIPVYLGISLEKVRDMQLRKEWLSIWRVWAKSDKKRINIKEWEGALKALGSLNSLIYNGDGEVGFREKIVDAVCKQIPPLSRWKVSHIRGCQRLVEIVCGRIDQAKESKRYGIPIVGLYGVGGIGKTTICHILCNEYWTRMQGRVFHIALGSGNYKELLQEALTRLTDKSDVYVRGLSESECEGLLEQEVWKHPMFLAIDNMSDDSKSMDQANLFLKGGFAKGSIVIITSRTLDVLENAHLGINESNFLKMPELQKEEAKSLFKDNATCDNEGEVDDEIINKCLRRCYFNKGDKKGYHYHPLALKVLGTQLGCTKYDRGKWEALLEEFDPHDIFSILRKSFDTLLSRDQMLFMDVAIFLPDRVKSIYKHPSRIFMTSFEWLSMVYGISVGDVIKRLKLLKKRLVIENVGDGGPMSIGMHDLWREFAIMESRAGKFEDRWWIYEVGETSALDQGDPLGKCWQNMKRMCLLGRGMQIQVNFDHYSNMEVLRLDSDIGSGTLSLDLRNLNYLKSLQLVFDGYDELEVCGLNTMKCLMFLQLQGLKIPNIDDIGNLTKLRVLIMSQTNHPTLPNVSRLTSLQEVHFMDYITVTSICALSSSLTNLRVLDLGGCKELQRFDSSIRKLVALEVLIIDGCSKIKSVPGLDDLVALKTFSARDCEEIAELPNLQKLTQLKYLNINGLSKIKSVPGLADLVTLERFSANDCKEIAELPNLQKLTQLKDLDIDGCSKIELVPGLDDLVALETFSACNCKEIAELPNQQKLTQLKDLDFDGCSKIELVPGVDDLVALKRFSVWDCEEIAELPNLQKLTQLKCLNINGLSKIKSVPGLADLVALQMFSADDCKEIAELPNLQKLTQLKYLNIDGCSKIESLPGLDDLVALETFSACNCKKIAELPSLEKLTHLVYLNIGGCSKIESVSSLDDLISLETFIAPDWKVITKLPNL